MNGLLLIGLQNAVVAGVLALLVWFITRIWRSAPVAHVLWLLVLIKLLTPPLVPVDLATWAPWRTNLQTGESIQDVSDSIAPSVSPRSTVTNASLMPPPVAVQEVDEYAHQIIIQEAMVHAYLRDVWEWCSLVLFLTWLGGICFFAAIAGIRISRFQRLLNGMLPAASCWQELTRELATKLSLRRVPRVLMSERVHAPLLWCFGRQRVIVLPTSLVNQLNQQQLELVLAHELAHLRRRDHWVRVIELLSSVIHWWNPVVWWARRNLHQAEEQCCDAWVNWLFPERVTGYAEVLLCAAESNAPARAVRPLLASPFFRYSAPSLKSRIETILRGGIRRTLTRPVQATLALVCLVVLPLSATWKMVQADDAPVTKSEVPVESKQPEEKGIYKLTGTVKVNGSDEPLAGATVRVLNFGERDGSQQKVRSGTTDAKGRYEVSLPIGDAYLWGLSLPAGYWIAHSDAYIPFALSSDQPELTKNFTVRREPTWKVRVKFPKEKPAAVKCGVNGLQQLENSVLNVGCELDQNGTGLLTIPGDSGPFDISIWAEDFSLERSGERKLQFEKGFKPNAVTTVKQLQPLTFELKDSGGRIARITGMEVGVVERQVELTIPTVISNPPQRGRVTGVIVDQEGKPLEGALVGLAFQEKSGGGAMQGLESKTDGDGRFTIERIPRNIGKGVEFKLSLVVTRDGYAGLDTRAFDANYDAKGTHDAGTIRMKPGRDLKVRIVDLNGNPAIGASIEPHGGGYAMRAQATRTDREGRGVLRNLSNERGVIELMVRLGRSYANSAVVLSKKEVTIRLEKTLPGAGELPAKASAKVTPRKRLVIGNVAPEWNVAEWSDGKTRKLADYRGKVVVLDFWGIWCGPCMQMMPVLQELEQRYSKEGVAFLSIHTSGTQMDQIKELQGQRGWKILTAVDHDYAQGEWSPQAQKIVRELEGLTTFDAVDQSLEEFCGMIGKQHGIKIVIDVAPLLAKKIDPTASDITVKVRDVSLKNAIDIVLKPKKLGYEISGDSLRITTLEAAQNPSGGIVPGRGDRSSEAFHVHAYPTILVIDTQGKIAFTSDVDPAQGADFMKNIEAVHKELGVPFPPDKDANGDEAVILERLKKVQLHIFGKAIEDVLEK